MIIIIKHVIVIVIRARTDFLLFTDRRNHRQPVFTGQSEILEERACHSRYTR